MGRGGGGGGGGGGGWGGAGTRGINEAFVKALVHNVSVLLFVLQCDKGFTETVPGKERLKRFVSSC